MKIKSYLLFLLFFISFFNLQSQTLVNYSLLGDYSKDDLEDILIQFGLSPVVVPVFNGCTAYKVTYNTPNATGTGMTVASGAVVFPKDYFCGASMACYDHGTTSLRYSVPSYESQEINLGLLWAGRGYATALPDYLGMGDNPGVHPYVHAKSQATASIDNIRAMKELAIELGIHLNEEQLHIFGYSQGGHAAMATCKEIQENHSEEFTVTMCAPMSGPYDLDGAQTDYVNSGQPYATPGYLPYIFLGYHDVYGNLYQNDISEALVPPYDTSLPPLFDGTNNMGVINAACPSVPTDMVQPDYQSDFDTNPNNPFRMALADNSLMNWVPQMPVRMMYCTLDEQVYYMNAVNAEQAYRANGAPDVLALNFGEYDHGGCFQFCMLYGIATMDSLKQDIQFITSVMSVEESSPGAGDGAIIIQGNPAGGNMTYVWSTEDTGNELTGISAGSYTVTITSEFGCQIIKQYDYDQTITNLDNIEEIQFEVFPNPTQDYSVLSFPYIKNASIQVFDAQGKLVYNTIENGTYISRIPFKNQAPGVYMVHLKDLDTQQQTITKILKQ